MANNLLVKYHVEGQTLKMTTSKLPKPYLSFKEEHTELFEAYERLGPWLPKKGHRTKKDPRADQDGHGGGSRLSLRRY